LRLQSLCTFSALFVLLYLRSGDAQTEENWENIDERCHRKDGQSGVVRHICSLPKKPPNFFVNLVTFRVTRVDLKLAIAACNYETVVCNEANSFYLDSPKQMVAERKK